MSDSVFPWPPCGAPRGCRRVFVEGLCLPAHIGVLESEQACAQRLVFDIDVWVQAVPCGEDIGRAFDIRNLRRAAENALAGGHVLLHETVADRMIAELSSYPGVRAVRVKTVKPDLQADMAGSGVETFAYV